MIQEPCHRSKDKILLLNMDNLNPSKPMKEFNTIGNTRDRQYLVDDVVSNIEIHTIHTATSDIPYSTYSSSTISDNMFNSQSNLFKQMGNSDTRGNITDGECLADNAISKVEVHTTTRATVPYSESSISTMFDSHRNLSKQIDDSDTRGNITDREYLVDNAVSKAELHTTTSIVPYSASTASTISNMYDSQRNLSKQMNDSDTRENITDREYLVDNVVSKIEVHATTSTPVPYCESSMSNMMLDSQRNLSNQVDDSDKRGNITDREYLVDDVVSNVKIPPLTNNVPYSASATSNVMFDSQKNIENTSASQETSNDTGAANNSSYNMYNGNHTAVRETSRQSLALGRSKDDNREYLVPFPQQLMLLLTENEFTDIINWMPNGLCFKVHDKARFEQIVLPAHFSGQCKYTSFTRKLHRWGFRRIDKLVYKHQVSLRTLRK